MLLMYMLALATAVVPAALFCWYDARGRSVARVMWAMGAFSPRAWPVWVLVAWNLVPLYAVGVLVLAARVATASSATPGAANRPVDPLLTSATRHLLAFVREALAGGGGAHGHATGAAPRVPHGQRRMAPPPF